METANLYAAWIGILCGFLAGAVMGMYFHRENWLGGFASWPRRMVRLGHISFFGLALVNLAFVFSVRYLAIEHPSMWASRLFILGAAAMPLVCYASAYRKGFRHLFPIPVVSLITGAIIFIMGGVFS